MRGPCGNLLMPKPSRPRATERSLLSCSGAVSDDESWPTSVSTISSDVRTAGRSSILSERVATFGQSCSRLGETVPGRLVYEGSNHYGQIVSQRVPLRKGMGRRYDRESGLARRQGVRQKTGD